MANGKLEGIDYVIVPSGTISKSGSCRKRRKPTLAELESRAAMLERVKRDSDAARAARTDENIIASLPSLYSDACWQRGPARDVLAYIDQTDERIIAARAPVPVNHWRDRFAVVLAERRGETPRKASSAVTAADVKRIAALTLELLGRSYPSTSTEAASLVSELRDLAAV